MAGLYLLGRYAADFKIQVDYEVDSGAEGFVGDATGP